MKDRMFAALVFGMLITLTANVDAGWFARLRAPKACSTCSTAKVAAPAKVDAVQKESATQKDEPVKEAVQKDVPADAVQKDEPKPVAEATQKTDAAVQKDEKAEQKTVVSDGGPMYQLCLKKANWQAARGRVGHPGWGFAGARAEGAGFSTRSAADAIRNTCFYGQRKMAASAVVRGRTGWYATCLYW